MALLFGVLCVCTFFALLFGLWGYSGLGWRAFLPFGVLLLVLCGVLGGRMVRLWG